MTLADLGRGQRGTVVGYGVEVAMVRRAPMRDPVIFRVGDYEIALRAEQTRCIYVDGVQ